MSYLDGILHKVTRPARYAGGEWNSTIKDWETVEVRIALAYPDLYEIGMSNAAIPILYELVNRQPHMLAERVFAPWVDMEAAMRAEGVSLFSLESKRPLKEFDIIGFSLSYELTYTNVLNMLDLAQIPVLATERNDSHPLIIAGGGCVLNPEPMADFIDLFVIGEGEEVLLELLETFRDWRKEGKQRFLRQAATISGIYVPSLYRVDYHADGTLAGITPATPEARSRVERRIVRKLPPPVTKPVIPFIEVVQDRGAVEIQRGCTRGCRFCQAGIVYRPLRERPQEEVMDAVGELVKNCGYNEVTLVSLSTSDYCGIEKLVSNLSQRYREHSLTLSLPSLRIDSFSVGLMDSLPSQRKSGLTFAPEAGSERLRHVINKGIVEEELLTTLATALDKGWQRFKLYFMLGLPTETMEDVESIVALVHRVLKLGRGKRPRIRLSLSTFIPKPHTPFQWVAQDTKEQLLAKCEVVRQGLRRAGVQLSWQDPKVSLLEAALSRGDRRLGKVIYRAWQLGCTFDAWSERFDFERWHRAFEECELDLEFYANRERPLNEVLPWAHIDVGVSPAFLEQEYQRTISGQETPDCRGEHCNACGLERWHPDCQGKSVGNNPHGQLPTNES